MESKKIISIFELTLLILASVAFAWSFSGYDAYGLKLITNGIGFFDLIPSVSAQQSGVSCCINSPEGNSCMEFPSDQCDELCDGTCTSSSCDQVNECKLGCCFDSEEGLCDPNTPRQECEARDNGVWSEGEACEVNMCTMGCCVIGSEASFVTEQRCMKLGEVNGLPFKFDAGIQDSLSCIGLANSEVEGACVFSSDDLNEDEKKSCSFGTKAECSNIGGDFYQDTLCSNPELNTVCERQASASCVDGKDGVYWFDSCGNRENIYSSDKTTSWNNGRVLDESQSCNPNSDNSNSGTCGNCDYELGSICGVYRPGIDSGNLDGYTCRDLNCEDAPDHAGRKQDRLNGESWCVYDGQIGGTSLSPLPSKDVVGSRHFKYVCDNGVVKSEPCADYRKEICVEDSKKLSNGDEIDSAICRVNLWQECIGYNGQNGCEGACMGQCQKNPDCRLFNVNVDSNFKFNTCVPKYPPGFDLGSSSGLNTLIANAGSNLGDVGGIAGNVIGNAGSNLGSGKGNGAQDICGLASKTCVVTYQKKGIPPVCKWECVDNCECESQKFTTQMTNLCASLGDCGVKANIVGKVTIGGASISKKGKHGDKPPSPATLALLFVAYSRPIAGQNADGGFFDSVQDIELLESHGIRNPFGDGYNSVTPATFSSDIFDSNNLGNNIIGGAIGGTLAVGVDVGIASTVSTVSTTTGAQAAAISGLNSGGFSLITSVAGTFAIGAALFIGLGYAMGCGDVETTEIKYSCETWERPRGGGTILAKFERDNSGFLSRLGGKKGCEACNGDPLKPCTKYRCESLGARCKLINENTGQDACITDDSEVNIPIITPWTEILNESYKYQDISNNGFKIRSASGECIQAFTPLIFGVKTDVYSQCKWDIEDKEFEDMENPFFEQNLFTINHTLATVLPSVDSLIASETNNPDEFNQLIRNQTIYNSLLNAVGDMNIHVKCANIDGDANDQDFRINFCVKPGPDLTPPVILATSPPEKSFVAFNASQQNTVMFASEPAECKWDTSNIPYAGMKNDLSCVTEVTSGSLIGYPCNATLPINPGSVDNKFYVSCRDQPWLGENSSRNIGSNYEYVLKRSESLLSISSILPEENSEVSSGVEPGIVDISIVTSGGAEGGKSVCRYSLDNQNFITMFETNSVEHRQKLNQLFRGNYTVNFRCEDSAGNTAEGDTSFKLSIDNTYPVVTRVYYSGGELVVLTDEDSICGYDYNSTNCNFNLNQSTLMSGSYVREHRITWFESDHYIKCEDVFGNHPGQCSIAVRPSNLFNSIE